MAFDERTGLSLEKPAFAPALRRTHCREHHFPHDTRDRSGQNASLHMQETLVPYPNDRRNRGRAADEPLSPEYLAMLVACGGEVRKGDRTVLTEAGGGRRPARRADDAKAPDLPAPKVGERPLF